MLRKIITIDAEKCNGCGLCANACHEGAIGMQNGKAVLLRDDYCDGLGDCLPVCPTGAIRFVQREAAAYDAAAVQQNMQKRGAVAPAGSCPGSAVRSIAPRTGGCPGSAARALAPGAGVAGGPAATAGGTVTGAPGPSELRQWPVQIKLVPVSAPYFARAHLLVAADCTAFAYRDFHRDFLAGRVALVGCPKLDDVDYAEKLAEILRRNDIQSVTVARMEVPCCGGLEQAVRAAIAASGKAVPLTVATISIEGTQLPARV